jgi:diguanylate cyclase (GGDEF)-like protein
MGVALEEKDKIVGKISTQKLQQKSEDELRRERISKTLNMISKQIISRLSKDKIPATPQNFKVYFEDQLEKKPTTEKREIEELLSLEESITSAHTAALEKDIQEAFIYIKSMAESVKNAFTTISQVKNLTSEKIKEMEKSQSSLALVSYEESLKQAVSSLEKELKTLKTKYNSTASLIKDFNRNSIFDKKYGIYNKKYLLKSIESIIKSSKTFDHDNTLLAIRVKPDILKKVKGESEKNLLNTTFAKLLYKRARSSDIVAHYENGIFMIILKHATIDQAKIAVNRIKTMIEETNFYVNGKDIQIEVETALEPIDELRSKEEIIVEAIDNLK